MSHSNTFKGLETSLSEKIIENLNERFSTLQVSKLLGVRFLEIDQRKISDLISFVSLANEFGVEILIGDDKGVNVALNDDLCMRLHSTHSHFSIVGLRSLPDEMETGLKDRYNDVVEIFFLEKEVKIKKQLKHINERNRYLKILTFMFFGFIALSMVSAYFMNLTYSFLVSCISFIGLIAVDRIYKKGKSEEVNAIKDFEGNKIIFWDNVLIFNEKTVMKKIYLMLVE